LLSTIINKFPPPFRATNNKAARSCIASYQSMLFT
jgi:hypothetical protein